MTRKDLFILMNELNRRVTSVYHRTEQGEHLCL